MLDKFKEIEKKYLEQIEKLTSIKELSDLRVDIFGKKGELTQLMKEMVNFSKEQKAEIGKNLNEVKSKLSSMIEESMNKFKEIEKNEKIKSETIDISIPTNPYAGSVHPITLITNELVDIMTELGFAIVDGPEIEYAKLNFDALNIPLDHPSREKTDTFYIDDEILLRTQTSPVQIRYMQENKPPLRMVSIGKVYRPDYDISHTPMFHQMEGLMIGRDVNFANFKALLEYIIQRLFGADRKVRFRPHFFPFTEPSAEMDVECIMCKGKGCRLCKYTGWLEILGSGMVNIKVLENVNLSEDYQGFAFGMGLERMAMLKYGIDDLRSFYENNNKFLEQFK